jgi:hypothetical protein
MQRTHNTKLERSSSFILTKYHTYRLPSRQSSRDPLLLASNRQPFRSLPPIRTRLERVAHCYEEPPFPLAPWAHHRRRRRHPTGIGDFECSPTRSLPRGGGAAVAASEHQPKQRFISLAWSVNLLESYRPIRTFVGRIQLLQHTQYFRWCFRHGCWLVGLLAC